MQITDLLRRVHGGEQDALHALIPLVYDELRKLAAGSGGNRARAGSKLQPWSTRHSFGLPRTVSIL
jgi:hypothetical protein